MAVNGASAAQGGRTDGGGAERARGIDAERATPDGGTATGKMRAIKSAPDTGDAGRAIETTRSAVGSGGGSAPGGEGAGPPEGRGSAGIRGMLGEWNRIEAGEMLRIVRGRLAAVERIEAGAGHGGAGAPRGMHGCILESPWLLDPSWAGYRREPRCARLLLDAHPGGGPAGAGGRLGLLAVGAGNTLHVAELMRPDHSVTAGDMNRLLEYVTLAKDWIGGLAGGPYDDVTGHIVAGRIQGGAVETMVDEARGNRRYARTYADLLARARRLHEELGRKLACSVRGE